MSGRARLAFALGGLVAVGIACNPVDPLQSAHYVGPQNVCTDTCADGASCTDGACRAPAVTYGMLLEVTPPTSAHYAGGSTFRFGPYANPTAGLLNETLSLARVSIRLNATSVTEIDKPIALAVRLIEHPDESAPVPGAILRRYEFRSDSRELATIEKGWGHVAFEVPAGAYDVYIAPLDAGVVAVLPPVLRIGQRLATGELQFVVGTLSTLSLTLTDVDSAGTVLSDKNDGWDVSVVDRVTGQTLSTVDTTCDHPGSAKLRLTPGLTQHTYSVRFTPPASGCGTSELRPNYDFDLDALDIGGTGSATAVLPSMASVHAETDHAPTAVQFGGWVVPPATPQPDKGHPPSGGMAATIFLRSTKINLPPLWRTGNAWYATTTGSIVGTPSLASGFIVGVQVVSGDYDIELVPDPALGNAQTFGVSILTSYDLTTSSDAARTLYPANPKTLTLGEIVGADGATDFGIGTVDFVPETPPAAHAQSFVQATRSQSVNVVSRNELDVKDCHDPTKSTAHFYNFGAFLDAGLFDVVIRTPSSSGFPWTVMQQVEVATPLACSPIVSLDKIVAVPPAQFSGTILDENGDPVAFANVQARAIVVSSVGKTLVSAPVVGQTQADEKGNYTILVPSKLATFQTVGLTK